MFMRLYLGTCHEDPPIDPAVNLHPDNPRRRHMGPARRSAVARRHLDPTPVNAVVVAGREPGVKIPANPAFAPFSVDIYGFPME